MHYSDLITLAETLGSFLGKSEATISNYCAGHARFFSRLRDGKGCTVATFHAVSQWFSDQWPEDLEWPAEIPRPRPSSPEEAA